MNRIEGKKLRLTCGGQIDIEGDKMRFVTDLKANTRHQSLFFTKICNLIHKLEKKVSFKKGLNPKTLSFQVGEFVN